MHKSLSTIFLAGLLAACGDPGQPEATTVQAPAKPTPVIIDNTPIEALQLGGTVIALRAGGSLADPEEAGWRDAQEYRLDLMMAPPVHPSINLRHDASAAPPQEARATVVTEMILPLPLCRRQTRHLVAVGPVLVSHRERKRCI